MKELEKVKNNFINDLKVINSNYNNEYINNCIINLEKDNDSDIYTMLIYHESIIEILSRTICLNDQIKLKDYLIDIIVAYKKDNNMY